MASINAHAADSGLPNIAPVIALDAVTPALDDHAATYAEALAARTTARVLRFGTRAGADVRAEGTPQRSGRGVAFELRAPQGSTAIAVAGLGDATVANALAAAGAARRRSSARSTPASRPSRSTCPR